MLVHVKLIVDGSLKHIVIVVILPALQRVGVVGLLTDGGAVHRIPCQPVSLRTEIVITGPATGTQVDAQSLHQVLDGELTLA